MERGELLCTRIFQIFFFFFLKNPPPPKPPPLPHPPPLPTNHPRKGGPGARPPHPAGGGARDNHQTHPRAGVSPRASADRPKNPADDPDPVPPEVDEQRQCGR